jgi:hypothetical protein
MEWKFGYFEKETRVRKINLSFNNLTSIAKNGFVGIEGIYTMILNDNLFESIPAEVSGKETTF